MEKNNASTQQIIISGPESTGKTELARSLAAHYSCDWVPELARSYIEDLNRDYTYEDVVHIAKLQIEQFISIFNGNKKAIFDTGLIITKVWFDVVYHKCPEFVIEFIKEQPKIHHMLCSTDIPWQPDSVRENGGAMREELFKTYINELEKFEFPFTVIKGLGKSRLQNAIKSIDGSNLFSE